MPNPDPLSLALIHKLTTPMYLIPNPKTDHKTDPKIDHQITGFWLSVI